MIQPKTLKAINYFIDEDIESREEDLKEVKSQRENDYCKGYLDALKTTRDLVNEGWKKE